MDVTENTNGHAMSTLIETIQLILSVLFLTIMAAIRPFVPSKWMPKKSVSDELVVITGSGSGIGRLLAIRFAKFGAKLALLDMNAHGNEETRRLIRIDQPNADVKIYTCDLNDRENVYRIMNEMKENQGHADILINNAGIVTGKKIFECPDEMMIKTLNVNALAHFWTVKSVIRSMLDRNHGHIVSIASAAGLMGSAGLVDYCASKFAAVGLTESLALELRNLGKDGVHTTTVCPYYVNTGMFHGATTRFQSLLPILDPDYVADKIMDAILTNQEVLIIPRILYFAYYIKSFLPSEASYRIADFLGITQGMDSFIGRNINCNNN